MKTCPHCKREFKGGVSFGGHVTNCLSNPGRKERIEKQRVSKRIPQKKFRLYCKKCNEPYDIEITEINFSKGRYKKFCSRKCANSRGPRTDEFKEKVRKKLEGVSRGGKKYFCKDCEKPLRRKSKWGLCSKCLRENPEFKKLLSEALKGKTGGYRDKGGRGKQGWYRGIYCNSSWELAYVIYNFEHNINLIRNKKGFEYVFEGKKFRYYPDFIIDGKYHEVKGYLDKKNEAKINQFPLELEVIGEDKIKLYLDYVIKKYGKDFLNLYE